MKKAKQTFFFLFLFYALIVGSVRFESWMFQFSERCQLNHMTRGKENHSFESDSFAQF